MRPLGGPLILEGIEIAADGRLRNTQFAHQFVECREPANPHELDQLAASLLGLHAGGLTCKATRMAKIDHVIAAVQ